MQAASSFAFLGKKPAPAPNALFRPMPGGFNMHMNEPDTNVISVHFDTLKQAEENLQMGDPYFCKHCRSCLSSASDICTKAEYAVKLENMKNQNNQKEEEKKEEEPVILNKEKIITTALGDNDKVWICEFCGTHNLLNLEQEEIPKTDDVIYLIKSAEQISKNPLDLDSDITTIFCIDNSGSMSVSQEITGKHNIKHGITEEEYEMLKQFIEYGADQYLPNQKKDTTFITRKQCVLAAIENQLLEMKNEFPNRKVGLVAFDSEVNVIGDGKNPPEIITGDKLYKYDVLRQIGENGSQTLITSPVKVSAESLLKKFESLKESGKTALGPALLVSIGLAAQGKQGSRVLLCTDGLANIGLGEMDTAGSLEKAEEFYTDIATFAKEKGVSVSVISIKGEGCKLDVIGKLADLTSGSLMRVDPNEITTKFANAMKDEVIGTQVDVKLRLHRGLKFRNALEELLRERGSLFEKNVGNVTAQTELTFEYETRPDNELMEFEVDLAKLQSVPFQAQVIYTSTSGDKLMRVITQKLKTTQNQQEAERNMRMEVMATRALQHQAEAVAHGHYGASEQIGQQWGNYFNNQVSGGGHQGNEKMVNFYQQKNMKMQEVARKKQDKIAAKPMSGQPEGLFGKVSNFIWGKSDAPEKKEAQPQAQGRSNKVMEEEEDDDAYEAVHEGKNFNKHKLL